MTAAVECVECGESFDPTAGGGWCPACGLYRWEGETDDESGGGAATGDPAARSCPDCGAPAPDGSFCARCGAALSGDDPVERVAFEVGPTRVTATDGETVGARLRTAHVEAGGDAEEARYVHREHVRVVVEGDAAAVVPVGENGTRVDGDRVPVGERRQVRDGDEVTFAGVVTARVRVERGERS